MRSNMSFLIQSHILDAFSPTYFIPLYISPDKVGQSDICVWSAHPLQRLLQHDWSAHQWSVERFFILRPLKTQHIFLGWVFKAIKHLYIIMLFTFETYYIFLSWSSRP